MATKKKKPESRNSVLGAMIKRYSSTIKVFKSKKAYTRKKKHRGRDL